MKVNELRIGNYVDTIRRDNAVHLPAGFPQKIGKISFYIVDLYDIDKPFATQAKHYKIDTSDLCGIPLTEDWLLKMEFKDMDMVCRKPLDKFLELCWFKGMKEMRLQTIDSGFTIVLKHINSVHDVQNFWKAHTGKELESVF